ncbi:hypothetical protein OEA41_000706 [Lepraria neglecta]|uniref:Methyltransferase domain-containing protein n=1 Tax=Lepraria neglecta TaxID=209136 RepID=A0AAE0DPP4_9LECA|nr:hypothetical protein OEA41_000706 [Lepraria neglecta]
MATSSAPSIFDGGVDFDWKKYITHRPDYTASNFYPLIWNYHERHSDRYVLAHDVGTGPGNVVEVLAKRFDRVIASDPSKFHVDVAQKRINTIWFYGRPIFADKKQEKCQDLYDNITSKAFERIFPLKASQVESAVKTMASWLDIVIFPSETWTDVQRIKWNNDKPLSFLGEEHFDHEIKYKSGVGPGDKIEMQVDRDFWAKEDCGVEWVKGFIDAQYLWETTDDEIGAQLEPMYEELEAAMGGKGSTVKIAWPVVLLLATKK